jgi:GNAT superfamily N-acetyltransferase
MRNIAIRPAKATDIQAVNALMHTSSAYKGDYYTIIEDYFVTEQYLAANQVFVAEQNNEILGFYSLIVGDVPDLDLMFVSDAAQGWGIGRMLIEHMKQAARQKGITNVQIGAHPPAVGFYERMGAVHVGTCQPTRKVSWARPLLTMRISEN